MLYSLGYNIPNTRKINFERCEVGSEIFCDALGDVTLLRYADDFIETTINDEKKTYVFKFVFVVVAVQRGKIENQHVGSS